MNGKADVFFFRSILFLCSILCIYSLMPLFSLPFRVVFVSFYSLVRFIRNAFFLIRLAHSHTHSSLSFISHFSSFSRLVHCLDTTSLMQYSLFFVRRFIRFHLQFHTLVMYIQFSLIQPTTAAMATTTMTKTTTTQWRPNECHCSPYPLKCMKIHWVKVR